MHRIAAILAIGLLAGTGCTRTPDDPLDSTPGTSSSATGFFQPTSEPRDDGEEPFWQTTFGAILPEGHWEQRPSDPSLCRPTNEDGFRMTNDAGTVVAMWDRDPVVVFGASDSVIDGSTCRVFVIVMGDYNDDLGKSYTFGDGVVSATYTPEQLFAGQDGGKDHFEFLE